MSCRHQQLYILQTPIFGINFTLSVFPPFHFTSIIPGLLNKTRSPCSCFDCSLHYFSSLLFFSYSTALTVCSDTGNQEKMNVAHQHHASNCEQNSPAFFHNPDPPLLYLRIRTAYPRNITAACMKRGSASKVELLDISITVSFSLL